MFWTDINKFLHKNPQFSHFGGWYFENPEDTNQWSWNFDPCGVSEDGTLVNIRSEDLAYPLMPLKARFWRPE